MKMRTFHNRVERREFTFDRSDLLRILEAETKRYASRPDGAAVVKWDLEVEEDGKFVTLTQSFEYLSPAIPGDVREADAVSPLVEAD